MVTPNERSCSQSGVRDASQIGGKRRLKTMTADA